MAVLSADQLSDIQGDLRIGSEEAVFTDTQLNRLFTRASSNYEKTVVLALRQMVMDAARYIDYRAGLTSQSKSQIYKQLRDRLAYFERLVEEETPLIIAGTRAVPPRDKDAPR